MATVSNTTIGVYAAIALGAIVLAIVLRTPYIAMFAGVGILAHAMITTPLPSVPTLQFPAKSDDDVSWVDASATPGVGLYSFFPNTDGDVAVWLTDVADASTARGYKITLQESGTASRLYLLDGTNGNASPTELDGTESIRVEYVAAVTRTNELPVMQIYFAPGSVSVYYVPSGSGDESPSTSIDYTQYATTFHYRHLSHDPSAVDDVLAAPPVVGVIGLETLKDPLSSKDTPGIVAPQWLPPNTTGVAPSSFTLQQSGWPDAKPFDKARFLPKDWTLSNGGQIPFNVVYRDTKYHQFGLCVVASPDPFFPPTSADLCVVFEFFVANDSDLNFENTACEIRIQPTGDDMFEKVSSDMCAGPDSCPYEFKDAKAKCYAHVEGRDEVHFHERSSCEYFGEGKVSEIVSYKKLKDKAPEFAAAIDAVNVGAGVPPAYYASVDKSKLEMGFADSSGNKKPLVSYSDLSDFPTLVSDLKYWGFGLYPAADWTPTTVTVTNVTTDF